ncbi:MAG: type II toxin-antitoxin system HicB family antitoxin [Bauldia sp.]|nr:type II toxin-antitoxin system HicB family antitoxin [Bauldia sp.]
MRYPVDLVEEDNGTVTAMAPNIPGAHSFGDDREEALARVVDAIESAIMALVADRKDIPSPSAARRRPTVALPALSVAKIGLYRAMREEGLGKAELARRLGRHLPQVDRILDLGHASRLDQVEAALHALGRELSVEVARAA